MSLKRIAARAGVSVMTVSRALNDTGYVSDETRRRVLAASRELQAFPQNRGRRSVGLKPPCGNVALLIDTDISSGFLSELVSAIQPCLAARNFHCMLHMFSGDHDEFLRVLTGLRPAVADACLAVGYFTDVRVRGLLGANSRTVFVDYTPGPSIDFPINIVSYDNVAACRMAAQQLRAAGCARSLCIQGREAHHFSRAMCEGYLAAFEKKDFEKEELLTGDFSSESGYREMSRALADGRRPDGVFATDEMAAGAMRAIREQGLRIPEDIQVMGCDGIDLGRELHPPLSTVVLDRRTLGERAVERLIALTDAAHLSHEIILLPPRLELRKSCVPTAREAN